VCIIIDGCMGDEHQRSMVITIVAKSKEYMGLFCMGEEAFG